MSKNKKTIFNPLWLEDDEFKSWLCSSKESDKARCKLCKKDFELSNMGRQALISHASGKRHKEIDIKIKAFFNPKKKDLVQNKENECKETSIESSSSEVKTSSSSKVQATIEPAINNVEHTKAEILWTLKATSAGYSNNSCTNNAELFQLMFPDSKIAQSFKLGPTKLKYLTNFGIAPHYKSALLDNVRNSPCHVISYDESLNLKTQSSEMDLLVRYFDEIELKVKTRYLDSQFLGHGTSTDLKRNFDDAVKELDPNKLIQVGMDGPNVNLKLLQMIQDERSANEQHQLIDIGSCGLHTIHNAFKNGAENTDWALKKTLKGSYQIFHNSPARREDFQTITSVNDFPQSFCATRSVLCQEN